MKKETAEKYYKSLQRHYAELLVNEGEFVYFDDYSAKMTVDDKRFKIWIYSGADEIHTYGSFVEDNFINLEFSKAQKRKIWKRFSDYRESNLDRIRKERAKILRKELAELEEKTPTPAAQ